MRILIDGDATPSIKLIEEVAKHYKLESIIFIDDSHEIKSDYSKIIVVSTSKDNVDINLINNTKKNDIIITQDFGVATLALSKKAYAISTKGLIFNNNNINELLEEKYIKNKLRKQKVKLKGPKKRQIQDDINLIESIERVIKYDQNK